MFGLETVKIKLITSWRGCLYMFSFSTGTWTLDMRKLLSDTHHNSWFWTIQIIFFLYNFLLYVWKFNNSVFRILKYRTWSIIGSWKGAIIVPLPRRFNIYSVIVLNFNLNKRFFKSLRRRTKSYDLLHWKIFLNLGSRIRASDDAPGRTFHPPVAQDDEEYFSFMA